MVIHQDSQLASNGVDIPEACITYIGDQRWLKFWKLGRKLLNCLGGHFMRMNYRPSRPPTAGRRGDLAASLARALRARPGVARTPSQWAAIQLLLRGGDVTAVRRFYFGVLTSY
jgi:hypothetical protein